MKLDDFMLRMQTPSSQDWRDCEQKRAVREVGEHCTHSWSGHDTSGRKL